MTFKRALITGITGSGGSYLAEHLVGKQPGLQVHGISRWHSTGSHRNLRTVQSKIKLHECDLNDFSSVFSVLCDVQPDVIFHIAANANVKASFTNPLAVMQNNVMSTANLYEAVRLAKIDPVIQLCSTSEVYGIVSEEHIPIKECTAFCPASPYAVSKVAQDLLGQTYFKAYNMRVIRTRMFTYLNPRRHDLFATAFAMQVARIEHGLQSELLHGNLDSVRTIIDVRDAMEAYWVAVEKGRPGEVYNIGGDRVIAVGEFLDLLKSKSKKEIKSRVDPNLLRPADVTLQIPDTTKFRSETGWAPGYSFEESVDFLLEYCRKEVVRSLDTKGDEGD